MDKVLFVELFQPFAQYRNPFTFYYAQTFPLPPKSTIVGMLQNALDDWYGNNKNDKWNSMKISIHGGFENIFWNYQQLIKGNIEQILVSDNIILYQKTDKEYYPLYSNGLKSQRTPIYQQELFNGHLFLFIKGDELLLDEIKRSLKEPRKCLSLGRSEDVIFIKKVEEVEGKKNKVNSNLWLVYPTYIKQEGFPIKNKKYPVFSIPIQVVFKKNGKSIKYKGEISKDTEREPHFTTVIYTAYDYIINLYKSIEIEKYTIIDSSNNKNGLQFKIPIKCGWL